METSLALSELLVVVHPGHLCGTLWGAGLNNPAAVTEALIREIEDWPGPKVAILGLLEDELDSYSAMRAAVRTIPVSLPVDGGDLERSACRVLNHYPQEALSRIQVTGAWANPGDGSVARVAEYLKRYSPNLKIEISPNAPLHP